MEANTGSFRLPPGFRFSPTDEELILHFLCPKVASSACLSPCHQNLCNIIPIVSDALHLNPWELDGKAWSSDGRQYFYFSTHRKNNKIALHGYWKDLDVDEPIFNSDNGLRVGTKKHLAFCSGKSPSAQETNWIMQEYHLCNCSTLENRVPRTFKRQRNKKVNERNSLILCRVQERGTNDEGSLYCDDDDTSELSYMDEMYLSKDDDFDDITMPRD